jgi:hypothetical protein
LEALPLPALISGVLDPPRGAGRLLLDFVFGILMTDTLACIGASGELIFGLFLPITIPPLWNFV